MTTDHPKPLPERIAAWLETQGYPLEMRAAETLRGRGFAVAPGTYYQDAESKEVREIDLVAYVQRADPEIILRISVVAECKSSRDKPWVVFESEKPRPSDYGRIVHRHATAWGTNRLCDALDVAPGELFTRKPGGGGP